MKTTMKRVAAGVGILAASPFLLAGAVVYGIAFTILVKLAGKRDPSEVSAPGAR